MEKPDSIREWYLRKVGRALKILWWSGIIATVLTLAFWFLAPEEVHHKLQVFNGAATIPVYGGLWLAAFILIWLVPMREVSFRGQESMERIEAKFNAIEERLSGTLDRIDRITERAEKKLDDRMLERFEENIEAIRKRIDRETQPLPVNRREEKTKIMALSEEAKEGDR